MARTEYTSDSTGGREEAQGSDGRLNVSSRADGRGYYNSRDESESYSMVFDDATASAGDFVAYIKNTDTTGKHLVVRSVGINSDEAAVSFKLVTVTGTAVGGATITPTNLNQGGVARSANAIVSGPVASGSTPMTGISIAKVIDHAGISAVFGHEEFRLQDQVRLGQDQAVAIYLDTAASEPIRAFGVAFFYFEDAS